MTDHVSPITDIEVGRYAVRTFRIDRRHRALLPVILRPHTVRRWFGLRCLDYRESRTVWQAGMCVARCAAGHNHIPPADDCGCGIYGATTLESLRDQYPDLSANIVAVIAAEGFTLIGTTGLRTHAARVVAYWCHPATGLDDARAVFAEQCPEAQAFTGLNTMLTAYDLPLSAPTQDSEVAAASPPATPMPAGPCSVGRNTGTWVTSIVRLLRTPVLLASVIMTSARAEVTREALSATSGRTLHLEDAIADMAGSVHTLISAAVMSASMVTMIWALIRFFATVIPSELPLEQHEPYQSTYTADLTCLYNLRLVMQWSRQVTSAAIVIATTAAVRVSVFLLTYALLAGLPTCGVLITTLSAIAVHVSAQMYYSDKVILAVKRILAAGMAMASHLLIPNRGLRSSQILGTAWSNNG